MGIKKDDFSKEFMKITEYNPSISDDTIDKIYEIGIQNEVFETFRNHPPKKAIEKLNNMSNDRAPYKKKYKLSIRNNISRKYISLKIF